MSEGVLELKYLFHGAGDAAVASILRLSNSIFNPNPESYYASLEEWKRRLSDSASSIVYLVPQPVLDRSPASSEDRDDQSRLDVPGRTRGRILNLSKTGPPGARISGSRGF